MSQGPFASDERRVEGRGKVTGATRFTADHARPGMLHAVFLTSPYARARIVRIDTRAARAAPGVHAVLTGADTRPARLGRTIQDRPVLCWEDVLFIGDRVAVVAAESVAQAEEAARLVEVEYEEREPLLDPEAALAPGAPALHPDRATYRFLRPDRPDFAHPNLQGHGVHEHGDVAGGFARAHRVFEGTYRTARTLHAHLEPRATLAWLEEDGVYHVVTTNKSPFNLRDQLASSLGLDRAAIVVETPAVGGDFGGKGLSLDEFALYFVARATGRPVRSVLRYADDVQGTNTRAAATIRVRTAVDRDGRFLAHEASILYDGGAYGAGKPLGNGLPGDALFTLAGYRVPAARIEARAAYTNAVPTGHARGPGQPQNAFAVESHLDEIAQALGLDPLELRLRNAPAEGDPDVLGEPFHEPTTALVLERLRAELTAVPAGAGRGIALGARHVGRGRTSLVLTLDADGAEVVTGVPDQGGGAHTMLARVVAAALGLAPERVTVRQGSTAEAREDPGVGGSRVTPVAGMAAQKAAQAIAARLASGEPLPLTAVGEHEQRGHAAGIYAYAVDVTVDRETGGVRPLGALLVADVGTVINPVALRGQLEGGFAFGLGQALMEELRVEDGRVTTANLGDYKVPSAADVPPLRVVLLTDAKGPGPFGAKSVGELANPAVGPAVANAVAAAAGVRVRSLPVSAERVLDALDAAAGG